MTCAKPETMSFFQVTPEPLTDLAVLHRHKHFPNSIHLRANEQSDLACKIQIPASDGNILNITLWNVHLDYRQYGPYDACAEESAQELISAEVNHTEQILQLIMDAKFKVCNLCAIFLH